MNNAEKEVIRRQYQRYRGANSFTSAVQLTAAWAEKHGILRADTRQVIYDANTKNQVEHR